jgi:hypothetical protein
MLIILAPHARLGLLWPELLDRVRDAGIGIADGTTDPDCT